MQTRHSDRTRAAKKNNRYGDDLVVDRRDLITIVEDLVGLEEIPASQDTDFIHDRDKEWIDERSKLEVELVPTAPIGVV